MSKIFSNKERERILEIPCFEYSTAGLTWSDGLLIGNGNIGAVAYAPNSVEWLVNKLDVFDGRVRNNIKMTPHDKVMSYMRENNIKDSFFLDELEKAEKNTNVLSISPLILKLHLGGGDLGWSAQSFPNVSQRVNISEGELCQKVDGHFVHSKIRSLTPRNSNLFIMRLSGCAIFDWEHTIEVFRPYHEDMEPPVWEKGEEGEIFFIQKLPDNENHYAVAVKIVMRDKDIKRVGYALPKPFDFEAREVKISKPAVSTYNANIFSAGDMDVFVAVTSSFSCDNPLENAKKEVYEAAQKGFEILENENKEWWKGYWSKSLADFGEHEELQKYWNFSMYELACSFGKAPMPTLNGLCSGPVSPTKAGVNSPFYTHDQNAQMPSMPLITLNHVELMTALIDTYWNAREEIKKHTKELFGNISGKGMFLPLTMSQKGQENPSGSYRYTLCGSAYTGLVLSLIWKYTHDVNIVEGKAYPLLCEFIKFYTENLLNMGEDGKYHLDLSVPPEIFTMTQDDSATISMLKTCIITAQEISDVLGDNNPDREIWEDVLSNYPEIAKREDGAWWSGPDIPKEHFCFGGHLLYPFFPSEACITREDKASTKKTLEYIEENALERTFADTDGAFHYLHDWSWLLTSMSYLRISQKDFFGELKRALGYFAKPNGLFSHDSISICDCSKTEENYEYAEKSKGYSADPGRGFWWYELGRCATENINAKKLASPVLEGNSIFLLCASETLLQSYDGVIRVFPCVPKDFTGKFKGFLAQGGFEVSASMENGKLKKLHIKAKADGELKIYCTIKELEKLNMSKKVKDGETILCCMMCKGDEIYEEF